MRQVAQVRALSHGLVTLSAGNYGAILLSLASSVILARRLGSEGFGRLALLLMVSQVLLLLTTAWTHTGFVRFGARELSESSTVRTSFWSRVALVGPAAVASGLVLVSVRGRVATYLDVPEWVLAVAFGHFTAACALALVAGVFQAREQMHSYGVVLFLEKLLMLWGLVVLPTAFMGDPTSVVFGYTVSATVVALAAFVWVGPRALLPPAWDAAGFRAFAMFSLPLSLSSWIGFFGTNWLDYLVIKFYVPLSALGNYSLGAQLAGVIQQVTIIFSTLLLPRLSVLVSSGDEDAIRAFAGRFVPYWLLLMSTLFSLVAVLAPHTVPLVFGEEFAEAAVVLGMLMLAAVLLAVFNVFLPLLSAYGQSWSLAGITLASAGLNVIADLALIPPFGVRGAAAATVLAYGLSATVILMVISRRLGRSVVGLSLFMTPAACTVLALLMDAVWATIVGVVGTAVMTGWLVARFGLFSAADVAFAKEAREALGRGLFRDAEHGDASTRSSGGVL